MQIKDNSVKFIVLVPPIIWGMLPMFMKIGYLYFNQSTLNFLRLTGALIFCIILATTKGWLKLNEISSIVKKIWNIALLFALFQILFALGVGLIPSSLTGMIFGLFPVTMTIINLVKGDERIGPKTMLGVILSFAGVVTIIVMSGGIGSSEGISLLGLGCIFISQVSYALFTYESKRKVKDIQPLVITMISMVPSILVFLAMSLDDLSSLDFGVIPLVGWVSVIFTGIFSMGIANVIWMWGAGKLGSMGLSLYSNINPVVALIGGIVILGESFNPYQSIGVVMVFAAIIISQMPGKQERLKRQDSKV